METGLVTPEVWILLSRGLKLNNSNKGPLLKVVNVKQGVHVVGLILSTQPLFE